MKLVVDEDAPDADCALDGETLLVVAAKETKRNASKVSPRRVVDQEAS